MFTFFIYIFHIATADLLVNTNSGPVQGVPSLLKDVEAFLGIPYAEPPVGDLRFAKPVPKKKWNDVYKASILPPPCTQLSIEPYYFLPDVSNMSEDCLYLNIWIPKSKSESGLRSIIIFLHPGQFVTGSSNMKVHDGSHLASRGDLMVVTLNYRLGALGYFLAYTEEADGNMGIYDQIMAIKWIKENAKYFNGDPENIVLMGVSAGAISISAHMVSPLSQNLFKRAIIQSASLLNPLYMDDNTRLYENSQFIASLVGCTDKTVNLKSHPKSVVNCLKTKPKEAFVTAEKALFPTNPILFYPRANDEFLPKRFVDLLREGKFRKDIDVLTGFVAEEGTMILIAGMKEYLGLYGRNDIKMNKYRALALSKGLAFISRQNNTSEISDFYLSLVKNCTSMEYTKMLANVLGDFSIICNTIFLADFLSVKGNAIYFYKFGFRAASTPMAEWAGATHLDEVQYVFGNPYHENFTAEEIELSQNLIDRWSAFARTGNPNIPGHVPWLRYSFHHPLYMHFGQKEESIRLRPNDRCEFWRKRFDSDLDSELIRSLRNSGMSVTTIPSAS